MEYWEAVTGSSRIDLMTEPPCFPVAPNTTRSFLSAMMMPLVDITIKTEKGYLEVSVFQGTVQ
jgi:hypothetical protein